MTDQSAPATEFRDLTLLGSASPRAPLAPGKGIVEEPFNKEKVQENIRGRIAQALVFTFVGFVGLIVLLVVGIQITCVVRASCTKPEYDLAAVRTLVELIMTPLVGLVGAVSGFYFGEKSANPRTPG